jgi:uncharacterized membrane protein
MKLLITFITLNVVNVILQTIKSLVTNKGGKWAAAIMNAIAYGFYTIVIVYMVCDLVLWQKVLVVGLCNLVGVYIVKYAEEKGRRDKLWKVELTVRNSKAEMLDRELTEFNIPHNHIPNVDKWAIFNVYCATQKESQLVKDVALRHNAKFFVSETKEL